MGKLRVMTHQGDRTVTWDAASASAVKEAERIFEEARQQGGTGFAVTPDTEPRKLERFDPEAEQIVVVPRIAGGA